MAEAPNTQQSLLLRLRNADDAEAWSDFARLYTPAILAFARRKGLQDADAADLAQEVLQSVARSMRDFVLDGRFRSWLFTVVTGQYSHPRYVRWVGLQRSSQRPALHVRPLASSHSSPST